LEKIGNWNVCSLETGGFRLDGGAMMGSVPKVLWSKTNPSDEYNRIDLSLRCLLLDNGQDRVLIETGMGSKLSDEMRSMFNVVQTENPLVDALNDVGCSKNDITHVILTHLHFDHSGGATEFNESGDIAPTFPNAQYYISKRNWQAANRPNPRDKASYLTENFECLEKNDQLVLLEDNCKIIHNIATITVDGHTAGQQLIKVESEGSTIIFVADLIPLKSHLKLPWIMGYDLNAQLTLSEKTIFLNDAAKYGWWLWFYHDPETVAVKITRGEKYYDIVDELKRKQI
jgi:glyoxylase-like metal-dependent hydrolase (beta-lactamase superfamily II)